MIFWDIESCWYFGVQIQLLCYFQSVLMKQLYKQLTTSCFYMSKAKAFALSFALIPFRTSFHSLGGTGEPSRGQMEFDKGPYLPP